MVLHFAQEISLSFRVFLLAQVLQGRVFGNIELSPYHLHGAFVVVLTIHLYILQVVGNVFARRQPIVLCMLMSTRLEVLLEKTSSAQLRKHSSLPSPSVLFKTELCYTNNFDLYNPYELCCGYLLGARGPNRRNRKALHGCACLSGLLVAASRLMRDPMCTAMSWQGLTTSISFATLSIVTAERCFVYFLWHLVIINYKFSLQFNATLVGGKFNTTNVAKNAVY